MLHKTGLTSDVARRSWPTRNSCYHRRFAAAHNAAVCALVRRARLEDEHPLSHVASIDVGQQGRDVSSFLRCGTAAEGAILTADDQGVICAWDPHHHYPMPLAEADTDCHYAGRFKRAELRGEIMKMHSAGRRVVCGTDRGEVVCFKLSTPRGGDCGGLIARMCRSSQRGAIHFVSRLMRRRGMREATRQVLRDLAVALGSRLWGWPTTGGTRSIAA